MGDCIGGNPNLIIEWDFRYPVNMRHSYSVEGQYSVDRWRQVWVPEIIRWRQEWKRMRDEWAEFLRIQSAPWREPLCRPLKHIPNFP